MNRKTGLRTILAAALCDAMNGAGTWDKLGSNQDRWLHRADDVSHELALRAHMIVEIGDE